MKFLFLLIFAIVMAELNVSAFAKCAGNITFSPNQEQIVLRPDQRLLIYTNSSEKKEFAFESEKDKVPAVVEKEIKSDRGHHQFLIRPSEKLDERHKYKLSHTNLEWGVEPDYSSVSGVEFKTKPVFVKNQYQMFGCGPSAEAIFSYETLNPQHYIQVEVTGHGKTQEAILFGKNNQLVVGFGMCGGPIDFKKGERYLIRFKLLDYYKNESEWTDRIVFLSPMQ